MVNNEYIIKQLASRLGIPELSADELLKTTIDCLVEELLRGMEVNVKDFGRFQVKTLPDRKALFFTPDQHIFTKKTE